jgi:uncharacterized protein YbaA (DUF1428 family)
MLRQVQEVSAIYVAMQVFKCHNKTRALVGRKDDTGKRKFRVFPDIVKVADIAVVVIRWGTCRHSQSSRDTAGLVMIRWEVLNIS